MTQLVTNENNLRPAHYRAITALVATGDIHNASKAVGASVRTLRRWMNIPQFRAELSAAETELVRSASCSRVFVAAVARSE